MLILSNSDVVEILRTHRSDVAGVVRETYRVHAGGRTSLPHSTFLRFPDMPRNRIIGLPAYVAGTEDEPAAMGMKWIASFPENVARGIERASAVIVLNSPDTGRPAALIEGSAISAHRTAASAAVGAELIVGEPAPEEATLVGCGPINEQILGYLRDVFPSLKAVRVFDLDHDRAKRFADAAAAAHGIEAVAADSIEAAISGRRLIALATTAAVPHLDLTPAAQDAAVLHISLRDLPAATILASQNVVDDTDHVSREQTSIHLAELQTGNRDFIDAEIGAILRDPSAFRRDPGRRAVYSPFGLGILDIALAEHVRRIAVAEGRGVTIDGFLPQ